MADVQVRVGEARLLTLTGVGGCGKTRLAVEVARTVRDQFPDGVWLVELGPLADPVLVPHSVAAVVGVREKAGQSTVDALATRLRARRLLLVLDNCEHLLDACAQLVDSVLRACADVRVLATSREALGITGEVAWRVPSLSLPNPQRGLTFTELQHNPAVQLFVDRALAAQSQFGLTERNAPTVAQVCERLDGIPLALELAAARVAALSVDQLLARLDQRFRLLTGGSRTALPRQQTLGATLDWSYELLSEAERCLFNRLSVFAGGWSLEAAEAVCAGEGIEPQDVLELLLRLVRKSLVVAEERGGDERYGLLETVREYARQKLTDRGVAEITAVRARHAAFYSALTHRLDPDAKAHPGWARINPGYVSADAAAERALDRLSAEQDNMRAALRWYIDFEDAEHALLQAEALFQIWFYRGSLTEGRAWLEELLLLPAALNSPTIRVRALPLLGHLARQNGDLAVALDLAKEVVAAREEAGDRRGAAAGLHDVANVYCMLADYPAAWASLEASRAIGEDLTDAALSSGLRWMGGQIALHEGQYELARTLLGEELAASGQERRKLYSGQVQMNLGTVAREQGAYAEAGALFGRSLQIAEESGDRAQLAHSLDGFSGLASALGQHERAMCLAGAAAVLREAHAALLSPSWRRIVDRWLEVSRAALSDKAAAAAWQTGQAMPLDEAIGYALGLSLPTPSSAPAASEPGPAHVTGSLTRREREVTGLIAQGLSNRQIGERLVITDRTVASHIEHILDKLAFTSRTQIGVWAAGHGLVAPDLA